MSQLHDNLTSIMDPIPDDAKRLPEGCDPWAIASDPQLELPIKLRRLRQLEYDVRQSLVATEEGMGGGARLPALAEVLNAIARLSPRAEASASPTKF